MCKNCTEFSARPFLQNGMDAGAAAALSEKDADDDLLAIARAQRDEARRERDVLRQERDEARAGARLAFGRCREVEAERQGVADELYRIRAEQPRPLTADAIEAVLHDVLPLTTEHLEADDIANIASDLHLALTEPTRPEGAEEWEDWLIEAMPHESMPDEDIALLADRIAARRAEAERDHLAERCTACGEDPSGPLRPLTTDERSYRYAQDLGYELPEEPR